MAYTNVWLSSLHCVALLKCNMVAPSSFWISSLFLEQTFKGTRPPPTLYSVQMLGLLSQYKQFAFIE